MNIYYISINGSKTYHNCGFVVMAVEIAGENLHNRVSSPNELNNIPLGNIVHFAHILATLCVTSSCK